MDRTLAGPLPIVDAQYCVPPNEQIDLVFSALRDGGFLTVGPDRVINFTVREVHRYGRHNLRTIYDSGGNPIVTMKPKVRTLHGRWKVYRGDSGERQNRIFIAKRHNMVAMGRLKLDVFLADNTAEGVPNFKVKPVNENTWNITAGDEGSILAEVTRQRNADGLGNFTATAYPNADLAFIVALTVIIIESSPGFHFRIGIAVTGILVGTRIADTIQDA